MRQKKIIEKLHTAFAEVEQAAELVPETLFFQQPFPGKWSVAEHADHLFLAVKPLVGLFGKPEVMLANWGKSNGISRSYNDLLAVYREKVKGVRTNTFVTPLEELTKSKRQVIEDLVAINRSFLVRASLFTEKELDMYQVPHPVIGMLTAREFLYFTHFHTQMHCETIRNLAAAR